MNLRNTLSLAILAAGFALSPSLSATSYTWDFTGSQGSNCTANPCTSGSAGNSITFSAGSGSPTIRVTAWYLDASGNFQRATLGQYGSGLGVCYPGEDCTNPNHQTDNNALDEFLLMEFSAPVDPSTVRVTTTTSGGSDTDASFWLGGNAGQNLNLTGTNVAGLAGLGFGGIANDTAANLAQNAYRDVSIPPTGVYVNKMLFGAKYGDNDDYFKVTSMVGNDNPAPAVPEPSSIILLATAGMIAARVRSRFATRSQN